ncbi:hypothetical protein [Sinorhizobium meliloti]|uniref:hypothetical protein n=1 Tax=Rhizobium meliloti TaxID=382 RepID=UPI000FD96E46|nr:hypothetical protein [Sinorhizobium meliloti]RVL05648.1 hypothetical protein CN152_03335 [Sinorhizobium meliloti]RVN49952.1 hypothetical protein CN113_06920 [Sinorhizobium meliloti]
MVDLTPSEKWHLELAAHRYWLGLMLIHAGTGWKVTRERIEEHLRSLKNGDPLERIGDDITAAQWDEENFIRYPIYEAVALEIIERLVAYEQSGKIEDLAFDI